MQCDRIGDERLAADIGTGSGCIAVSLAKNVPGIHVLATDISPAAIKIGKSNAKRNKVLSQIEFLTCDILPERGKPPAGTRQLDLVCANLPYIPTEKLHSLAVYGREPTIEEIAQVLSIPEGTAKSRLFHAHRLLRDNPRCRKYFSM